jgi:hypothetical protein
LALISCFLIVLCSVVISLVTVDIFDGVPAPLGYFIWPPFAFYRALSIINNASYDTTLLPYTMAMIKSGDEVYSALVFMIVEIFVFLFISFYLDQVFRNLN